MMNLLIDPVFQTVTPTGPERLSLPGLLAGLGDNRIETLPGLQRHQEDVFHIFLCYLAGAVLSRSGKTEPSQTADFWRDGLRLLAGRDDDSAWTLIVGDPTRPAFMQPPAPSRDVFERDYKPKAENPDALDVLQKAKNHEVKSSRAIQADLEAWPVALIVFQTSSGFLGRGNYGIARMNTGSGSRICVRWQSDPGPAARFHRETSILLQQRSKLLTEIYPYQDGGKTLLWLEPWGGSTSLPLSSLDPFFTEVCRRVRLVKQGEIVSALGATSSVPRLASKELKGNVGDPWTPIDKEESKALTVPKEGFTPKRLRDLIFRSKYSFTPMQIPQPKDHSGWFCASVLVRGQGTTGGFHEAAIRVPEKARPLFLGQSRERDRLAELSQEGLDIAAKVQNKVLRPALYALMEGGPDQIDFGKREVSDMVTSMAAPFAQGWRPRYFDWLWTTLDQPDKVQAIKPWFQDLRRLAEKTFEQAVQNSPLRRGRGYRSVVRAGGVLYGGLKKQFPQFLEERNESK